MRRGGAFRALALSAALSAVGCGIAYDAHTEAYAPGRGLLGEMDLLVPRSVQGEAARPGVLVLHAGSWRAGDKASMAELAGRLAAAGFVVANANYRLAPAIHFPASLGDTWCALAFLRHRAEALGLDASRIAVLGYSAGGNLGLMMALAPAATFQAPDCPWGPTEAPVAVVGGGAPTDLLHLPSLGDPQVADYVGATKAASPELYAQASPLTYARAGAPPALLIHGTQDLLVPVGQVVALRDGLRAAGSPAELLLLAGGGHQLNPGADVGGLELAGPLTGPEAWAATLDFLRRTLGAVPP